ncbi:unnamed protein product [Caenorhabditis auriculariae]|uniref:Uncharacterized protein n=1 Tax=Caenorhabditis auriculariae TaxID=2777116 RepID=A0A8S1HQV0_9PELO|nr:unnamed protein product [Caenorhabditis auriculariae]
MDRYRKFNSSVPKRSINLLETRLYQPKKVAVVRKKRKMAEVVDEYLTERGGGGGRLTAIQLEEERGEPCMSNGRGGGHFLSVCSSRIVCQFVFRGPLSILSQRAGEPNICRAEGESSFTAMAPS